MAMFELDEGKLREAFAGEDDWIEPFDPMWVDADQLHRVVDACLERKIITPPNSKAWLAIYPLSIAEPEPLLSVNPGGGPILLGGSVTFAVSNDDKGDLVTESVVVLEAMVEAANALYAESEVAKTDPMDAAPGFEQFIRVVYTEADVRDWAKESDGAVDEEEAVRRARRWGSHFQETAAHLCFEQLKGALLDDQP